MSQSESLLMRASNGNAPFPASIMVVLDAGSAVVRPYKKRKQEKKKRKSEKKSQRRARLTLVVSISAASTVNPSFLQTASIFSFSVSTSP